MDFSAHYKQGIFSNHVQYVEIIQHEANPRVALTNLCQFSVLTTSKAFCQITVQYDEIIKIHHVWRSQISASFQCSLQARHFVRSQFSM
jgi:hypothetical protein